jgi:hypothetical protein
MAELKGRQKIMRAVQRNLPLRVASVLLFSGSLAAAEQPTVRPASRSTVAPKEFGVQDQRITVVSAMAFKTPVSSFSPSLGRYSGFPLGDTHYYANLDLPAGIVIDWIGLNSTSDTDSILGVALWQRDRHANMTLLAGFSAPAHGWQTDLWGPLAIPITDHADREFVLDVEQAPSPDNQYFAWVEVRWHRTVSPPPAIARFLDVPTDHPFYQYIEALWAAGISAGCGENNFCPDQPITRKQEAAFIATALGLHWPN